MSMQISTLEDADQAVERGLASCYGLDGGKPWVGFGDPGSHGGQQTRRCPVFLDLPASDAAVRACQLVQQGYMDERRAIATHKPASDAVVEAEIRRACAAYPEIGEVTIGYEMYKGTRWLTVNGRLMRPTTNSTYDLLRRSTNNMARHMAGNIIPQPCAICRGAWSLLCHACKGGVGS